MKEERGKWKVVSFKFHVSRYMFPCLPVYLFTCFRVYGDLPQCVS